jgi:hypothetical protein
MGPTSNATTPRKMTVRGDRLDCVERVLELGHYRGQN